MLPTLAKIKNLFTSFPNVCIDIANTLSYNLTKLSTINDYLTFIHELINAEHNSKKKIVYIQMLKGVIHSLSLFLKEEEQKEKNFHLN